VRWTRSMSFFEYDENDFEKVPLKMRAVRFLKEFWLWILLMLALITFVAVIYSNPADGHVLYLSAQKPDRAMKAALQEYLSEPVPDINTDGIYVMKLETVDPADRERLEKLLDGKKKYLVLANREDARWLIENGYLDTQYDGAAVCSKLFFDAQTIPLPEQWTPLLADYFLWMPTMPDRAQYTSEKRYQEHAQHYLAAWSVHRCMQDGGLITLNKNPVQPLFEK